MVFHVVQGAAYGFAAAVQPGPFQAYLISQVLRNGCRKSLPIVLAPLVSDGPIILLTLFALSRVPPWWVQALRFVGGFYILYLAAGAWRSCSISGKRDLGGHTGGQSVFQAAFVNLLNPSAYLYWGLVTGPLLISGWREGPSNGVGFLVGFYVAVVASLTGILLAFAYAGQRGEKLNRWLLGASGVALAVFGIYQLALGFWGWRP